MKLIVLLFISLLHISVMFAQKLNKKDTAACKCQKTFYVNYPNVAEEDELEGTVIIEYEIDSNCIASNPKVVQNLGELFDKEALRVVNLFIANHNFCRIKCKYSTCEKRKVKLPLTFRKSD